MVPTFPPKLYFVIPIHQISRFVTTNLEISLYPLQNPPSSRPPHHRKPPKALTKQTHRAIRSHRLRRLSSILSSLLSGRAVSPVTGPQISNPRQIWRLCSVALNSHSLVSPSLSSHRPPNPQSPTSCPRTTLLPGSAALLLSCSVVLHHFSPRFCSSRVSLRALIQSPLRSLFGGIVLSFIPRLAVLDWQLRYTEDKGITHLPAIHGGLLKPDVVEGTDDERVWSLPCWDLTETSKRDDGIDLLKDNQALQRLTGTAEKTKMNLSSLTQTNISLPFITATADGPKHIETTITREKFEELCFDLLDRLKTPVENSLRPSVAIGLNVQWRDGGSDLQIKEETESKTEKSVSDSVSNQQRNQRRIICIPSLIPSLIRNGIGDGIHKFINSVSDSVANQQRNQRRNAITNVPFLNKFHFCSVSVPFLISVSKSVSNRKRIFSVSNQKWNQFSVSDRISDDVFRDGTDSVSVPFLIAIRDGIFANRRRKISLHSDGEKVCGNYIPISPVRDDVAAAYNKGMEWKASKMLLPYKQLCSEKKVAVSQDGTEDAINDFAEDDLDKDARSPRLVMALGCEL
ncbi:hypothetical protein Syun_029403 [Stephania yunnanensis]|uniref:Uncharacterized protein n=1 Tax=Stephania yunnanensis TaxID=152371 RepID=A0AAP0EDJ6_9MAGN